jgi:predicted TIM-barrel fold metal-dependent hydrolase
MDVIASTDLDPAGTVTESSAVPMQWALDMHAHVWPAGRMHPSQTSRTPLAAEPGDLLATIASAGVDLALIIPASIHDDNEEILRVAAAAP